MQLKKIALTRIAQQIVGPGGCTLGTFSPYVNVCHHCVAMQVNSSDMPETWNMTVRVCFTCCFACCQCCRGCSL